MSSKTVVMYPRVPQTDADVRHRILEITGDENSAVIFPTGYPKAFIGVWYNGDGEPSAVYSKQNMTTTLMTEDKMDYEEAVEFLEFNTWNTHISDCCNPIYIDTYEH